MFIHKITLHVVGLEKKITRLINIFAIYNVILQYYSFMYDQNKAADDVPLSYNITIKNIGRD